MVKDSDDDDGKEQQPTMKAPRYLFKVVVIGEEYVGKTCLLQRYTKGDYQDSYVATIGIDFVIKVHEAEDTELVKLEVWDTAGQQRFPTITNTYMEGASGILLVYSVTDRDSFKQLAQKLRFVQDVPTILVGNKCDMESKREVTYEEGKEFADENGFLFYETSVRENTNVHEVFDALVNLLVKKYKEAHANKSKVGNVKANQATAHKEEKQKSKTCSIL